MIYSHSHQMMNVLTASFFSIFLICSSSRSTAQPSDTTFHTKQLSIEKLISRYNIPAIGIGIIENGKLRQIKVYGELTTGKPAPYNSIFNVASLTKPIVTMLTLRLVSSGDWSLDEPVYKYWTDPDVANDSRSKKLTTRHILTHQTGFPNWRNKKLAFAREPGTKFGYSGEGFEYLRSALEHKFHKPLEELADSLIFEPLKMNDTRFCWTEQTDESRFALWHNAKGEQVYKTFKFTEVHAADDLLTTIEDYCIFTAAVMNGFGLPRALFDEMISPLVKIKDYDYMGLGWELEPDFGGTNESAVMHSGGDKGVKTLVFWLPKTKKGLIIFTNSDNGGKVYDELIHETFGIWQRH